MNKYFLEKRKRVPVSGAYDVAVAGAGIAGAAGAVSAARNGAKTCLIEKENSPGGLATLGLIAIYLPLCDGMGNQVISGIPEELLKLSLKYGPGEIPDCWRRKSSREERKKHRYRVNFNPSSFVISLEEFILENNVDIFYDSRFCDCLAENDRIKAILIENKSGRSAVEAKAFVDATGDADLCEAAGEKTITLKSNKRAGWYQLYKNGKIFLKQKGDHSGRKPVSKEATYSGVNARDVTEMNIESRKVVIEDLKKNGARFQEAYPVSLPGIPQFRMTRRIKGLYELDESQERVFFEDSICMAGDWRNPGPVFYIPLRCLIGKTQNLFAAGRCVSVTEPVWDITRAIPVCAATGEAAGAAAAVCASGNIRAQDLNSKFLRKKLTDSGVIIDPRMAR